MKIAFTICSLNYLPQAFALGDSMSKTNPQYKFIIGLTDKLDILYDTCNQELISLTEKHTILEIDKLNIPDFENFFLKYDIGELNASAKPFYFNYFFRIFNDLEQVIYFDADVLIYSTLNELDKNLKKYNFVITPHILTPINDDFLLGEKQINNTGIYNMGFIALKKTDESQRFIDWWMDRLYKYCYIRFEEGLFVDQIWINFLPLFFEKTLIERDFGYNFAYWNLHERTITQKDNHYFVNGETELKFLHFSGFQTNKPDTISKYQNRYTFEQRKDIKPLFDEYIESLNKLRHDEFITVKCYYREKREEYLKEEYLKKKHSIPLYKWFLRKLCDYCLKKLQ
jgi:hypothetical protein